MRQLLSAFTKKIYQIIGGFIFLLVLSGCGSAENVEYVVVYVTPTPITRTDVLVPGLVELVDSEKNAPAMPENPSQADLGSQVYYQICLACHGDWGQGLTEEWRDTWGDDKNCWQSKCHAANHPPWGFEIPKIAPPLLGMGSLARFTTAAELHDHIALTMPWWNPGSLTEDQAWQVTAYLLRERGELVDEITLDETNASIIQLHRPAAKPADHLPGTYVFLGLLLCTGIVVFWNSLKQSRRSKQKRQIKLGDQLDDSMGQTQMGDG